MQIVDRKTNAVPRPHFAALVFETIHIEGDERSRNFPGHGYPAETRHVVAYYAFDSREEMVRWVTNAEKPENIHGRKPYQIIEVKPCTVSASIAVTVA